MAAPTEHLRSPNERRRSAPQTKRAYRGLHARGTRTAIRPFTVGDAVSDASRRRRPVPNGAGLCAWQVIAQQPIEASARSSGKKMRAPSNSTGGFAPGIVSVSQCAHFTGK